MDYFSHQVVTAITCNTDMQKPLRQMYELQVDNMP